MLTRDLTEAVMQKHDFTRNQTEEELEAFGLDKAKHTFIRVFFGRLDFKVWLRHSDGSL